MKSFDMNLLKPLQALLEEANVSRAATRLHMSQPATSDALRRLRRYYDDDLLVRSGRSMALTPFAQALLPTVVNGLSEIRNALDLKHTYMPAESNRRFVIAATDYVTALIAGPLLDLCAREAPRVSLDFIPLNEISVDLSMFARLDAIIGPENFGIPGNHHELFTDDWVILADSANPVLDAPLLDIEMLENVPHAIAFLKGPDDSAAEKVMKALNMAGKVQVRLFGLATLPFLVANSNFVALVPRMLAIQASRTGALRFRDLPAIPHPRLTEMLYWHPRDDLDPAISWLRHAVRRAAPH